MSETTSDDTELSMRSVRFSLEDIVRDLPVAIADAEGTLSPEVEHAISETEPHLVELKGKYTLDDEERRADDIPVMHPMLDDSSPLPWDMAVSPDDLNLATSETDLPAILWSENMSALTYFTVVVEGIYKWPISVTNSEENGGDVSVMHTLAAVYENASRIVRRQDAEDLPPYTRALVYKAREARCREFSLPLDKEPLKRVDFFMDHRVFRGLSRDYDNPTSRQFTLNIGPLDEVG